MAFLHPWYNRSIWRTALRPETLCRHPLCVDCRTAQSTIADHITPWKLGKNETEQWFLFTGGVDYQNLTGRCKPCHDAKTASQDGGFGHRHKVVTQGVEQTAICSGVPVKFVCSSFPDAVDKALGIKKEEKK